MSFLIFNCRSAAFQTMLQSVQSTNLPRDNAGNPVVSDEVKRKFDDEGLVLIPGLLSKEEINILRSTVENDNGLKKHAYGRNDGHGRTTRVVLWNKPGNDVTGAIARCEKVADTMEKLLGGEVYHYHSKIIMKDAHTGGMHVWHQDYGYWYNNGCLFPNMGTVFIAIDRAHRGNGCLKVIGGSHKMGRVDHCRIGDQAGIGEERMTEILKRCEILQAEMEPGDALFFHCNIIHKSDQNKSDQRRWAHLVAYNRADNNPVIEHHHARYTPLNKIPNKAIMSCKPSDLMDGKDFFSLDKDMSVQALDPNFMEEMRKG